MLLRVLGIVLVIWLAVSLLGAVFQFLTWALVIGAVVALGVGTYSVLKNRNRRSIGR